MKKLNFALWLSAFTTMFFGLLLFAVVAFFETQDKYIPMSVEGALVLILFYLWVKVLNKISLPYSFQQEDKEKISEFDRSIFSMVKGVGIFLGVLILSLVTYFSFQYLGSSYEFMHVSHVVAGVALPMFVMAIILFGFFYMFLKSIYTVKKS